MGASRGAGGPLWGFVLSMGVGLKMVVYRYVPDKGVRGACTPPPLSLFLLISKPHKCFIKNRAHTNVF